MKKIIAAALITFASCSVYAKTTTTSTNVQNNIAPYAITTHSPPSTIPDALSWDDFVAYSGASFILIMAGLISHALSNRRQRTLNPSHYID